MLAALRPVKKNEGGPQTSKRMFVAFGKKDAHSCAK